MRKIKNIALVVAPLSFLFSTIAGNWWHSSDFKSNFRMWMFFIATFMFFLSTIAGIILQPIIWYKDWENRKEKKKEEDSWGKYIKNL